jgi:hypothetical protein
MALNGRKDLRRPPWAAIGPNEAVNLLIEKIRPIGHGFRSFEN